MKMTLAFLFVLIFAFQNTLWAEENSVESVAVDSTLIKIAVYDTLSYDPLHNATVAVNGEVAEFNSTNYQYEIKLPDGKYEVVITGEDIIEYKDSLTVPDSQGGSSYYFMVHTLSIKLRFSVSNTSLIPIDNATVIVGEDTAGYDAGLWEYALRVTPGTYALKVSAPNYNSYEAEITVPDEEVPNNFYAITLRDLTNVKFNVTDDSGYSITTATVTLDGDTLEYSTGLQQHSKSLADGTYEYLVSAEGYKSKRGNITVPDENTDDYYIIMLSVGTGIKDLTEANINIYPNPTTDYLKISLPATLKGEINLRLFSMNGTLLLEEKAGEGGLLHAIDMSAFAAGKYLLELQAEGKSLSSLVVKQ